MNIDVKNTVNQTEIASFIAEQIMKQLSLGKHVTWLVSGGSCVPIVVEAAKLISPKAQEKLVLSLVDERYGPLEHKDSNWQQLQQADLSLPYAKLVPVLQGSDRATTTVKFNAFLKAELSQTDYALGFFGVGSDGHTSGILPHSLAIDSTELVTTYDGGGYERITTTPIAILKLSEAIAFAAGEEKWPALKTLLTANTSTADQPAQLLKQVPKLTLFTDFPS